MYRLRNVYVDLALKGEVQHCFQLEDASAQADMGILLDADRACCLSGAGPKGLASTCMPEQLSWGDGILINEDVNVPHHFNT